MSDTIQVARAALARWGEGTTPGPWHINDDGWLMTSDDGGRFADIFGDEDTARLIVAMTDPALREALDGMLAAAQSPDVWVSTATERIAAVILDIDGRVSA